MLRERGVIVHVESGAARVALIAERAASCGSCTSCGGTCRLAQTFIEVSAPPGLRPGDEVTVEIPGPGVAAVAVLLLLVPVVLFVVGILASSALQARGLLPGGDGAAVLVAIALTAAWYAVVAAYDRRLRRSSGRRPRLVEWPVRAADEPPA